MMGLTDIAHTASWVFHFACLFFFTSLLMVLVSGGLFEKRYVRARARAVMAARDSSCCHPTPESCCCHISTVLLPVCLSACLPCLSPWRYVDRRKPTAVAIHASAVDRRQRTYFIFICLSPATNDVAKVLAITFPSRASRCVVCAFSVRRGCSFVNVLLARPSVHLGPPPVGVPSGRERVPMHGLFSSPFDKLKRRGRTAIAPHRTACSQRPFSGVRVLLSVLHGEHRLLLLRVM